MNDFKVDHFLGGGRGIEMFLGNLKVDKLNGGIVREATYLGQESKLISRSHNKKIGCLTS